jgi:hypothetical protein
VRKLLVLLSALLALVIVAPTSAAAAATVAAPIGALQSAVTNPANSTVVMTGWALDRGARTASTTVRVTVDGVASGGWRTAGVLRTDVNRAQSATGGHGFSISLAPTPGKHQICVDTRLRSGAQVTSLGCFSFTAYRMATAADMKAIAATIDPRHTIAWQWKALPAGTLGQALPWNGQVSIASGQTIHNLRDVMIHEWSHVLQYRAFGGSWWDAVQAFNALIGNPTDRSSYAGIEHGADCIAQALGAGYLGYGCSPALRTYGALVARGVLMTKLQGAAQVTTSGSTVTVSGWAIDPAAPTTATTFVVTDNGKAVTRTAKTVVNRSDANTAVGTTGTHGFSVKVSVAKGKHVLCVSANYVATGKAAATVGKCTTVTTA